jgi:methionyl-tRNA synthetase
MRASMKDKFFITTAIDYANNVPHLGTAYEKVCADIIARYMRLKGRDTFFSMGNDEHSQNVYKGAISKGLSPEQFTDQMAAIYKDTWQGIAISYDRFIRTTEERHQRAVEELFRRIEERGDIHRSKYAGWYCVSCEGFLKEEDLVDGECPAHRMEPKWIEEENLFFALSKYSDHLLEHIESHPGFIQPETRRNEIVSFIRSGLSDVSVSRSGVTWGISVPTEPAHVFYVWFDALINYLTAIGFPDDMDFFNRYWPADLHIIGKDITRFHCVLWPAMLMSAGIELPLAIHGHGFVTFRGERMSKTLGNIVEPLEVAKRYGPDSLRYYLAREVVFGKDGDFSWEQFIQRYNSELANDLGNLVSRTTGMIKQFFGGAVPDGGQRSSVGGRMREACEAACEAYFQAMDGYEIHIAISEVFGIVRAANRYIEERAPWALMKQADGRQEAAAVLFDVCEVLRSTAVLLFPFMPLKAGQIWKALGIDGDISGWCFDDVLSWRDDWRDVSTELGSVEPLFPRIEIESTEAVSVNEGTASGSGEVLDIEEFRRLDLRIARVKSAEMVAGAKKLIRLEVDIGDEVRQVVAGIADHYRPDELVGRSIVVVANLKPAKIRGVESQGMLLAATDGDKVIILMPEKEATPGAKIS